MKTKRRARSRVLACLALLCLLASSLAHGVVPRANAAGRDARQDERRRARRLLLISVDGLDWRYVRDRQKYGLKTPTLKRLLEEGVASAGGLAPVYPSVTYPNHTTMVTGAPPAVHGIYGNEQFTPLAPLSKVGHWFARDIRAETLWDAAARAGLKVGLVSWPVAGGAGDWNVPEIWKPGGTALASLAETAANVTPRGLVQEIAAQDRELFAHANEDEADDMRVRSAEYIIREKRPDVMLVHLFDFDHFQHKFGPFTPEAFAMLEKQDAYVARLLAAAERAGTLQETAVAVVSDHGFRAVSKEIHPNVILQRAGLLKTREDAGAPEHLRLRVTEWSATAYITGGSCSIILRDPRDARSLSRARAALKAFAARRGGRVFRVLEAAEVRGLGANPGAAFMLEAGGGYQFGKNFTGAPVTPAEDRGQHGYLPESPDYRATFLVWGAGVTRVSEDPRDMSMLDVGPTLALLLGLRLKDGRGRALPL